MGFFATFNGLIYNEFFAIPIQLFGTCYREDVEVLSNAVNGTLIKDFGYQRIDPTSSCVYPIGFDPVWFQSDQLLAFTNNFKMKTSVIFAILQMSIGIFLKGMNSLYFRHKLDFFFEFIPQIILILVLFGWMDLLLIGKWNMEKNVNMIWDNEKSAEYINIHKAPAIITTMIDIFLNVGSN